MFCFVLSFIVHFSSLAALQLSVQTPVVFQQPTVVTWSIGNSANEPASFDLRARGISDPTILGPHDTISTAGGSGTVEVEFDQLGTFVFDAVTPDSSTTFTTSDQFNVIPPSDGSGNGGSSPNSPTSPVIKNPQPPKTAPSGGTPRPPEPPPSGVNDQNSDTTQRSLPSDIPIPSGNQAQANATSGFTDGSVPIDPSADLSGVGPVAGGQSQSKILSLPTTPAHFKESSGSKIGPSQILIIVGTVVGCIALLGLIFIFGLRYRRIRMQRKEREMRFENTDTIPDRNQPTPSFIQDADDLEAAQPSPSLFGPTVQARFSTDPAISIPRRVQFPDSNLLTPESSPSFYPASPLHRSPTYYTFDPGMTRYDDAVPRPASPDGMGSDLGSSVSDASRSSTRPLITGAQSTLASTPPHINIERIPEASHGPNPTPPANVHVGSPSFQPLPVPVRPLGGRRQGRPDRLARGSIMKSQDSSEIPHPPSASSSASPHSQRPSLTATVGGSSRSPGVQRRRVEEDWTLSYTDEPLPLYVETPLTRVDFE